MKCYKLTDEQKIDIVNLYQTGKYSCAELGRMYKVKGSSIISILTRRGIKINKDYGGHKHKRKYQLNENYFDIIDNEHKAYWLGFLYADGYHHELRYLIRLSLQETDGYILDSFANDLESTKPLYIEKPSKKGKQNSKIIAITSKHMSCKIKELGIHQNKSFTIKFPTNKQVPDHLIHHFIRGYLDGDGWISISKSQTYRLGFVGSKDFISQLCLLLSQYFPHVHIHITHRMNNSNKEILILGVNQLQAILDIADWIYKDATIYLDRKFNKYKELEKIKDDK